MTKYETISKPYTTAGKRLIRVGNNVKIPIDRNYNKVPTKLEVLQAHQGNFAWKIESTDLVVDVDPRNGGTESLEMLCAKMGTPTLLKTVLTPQLGAHIYLARNPLIKLKTSLEGYSGLDFLTNICTAVGSCINGSYYRWADEEKGFFQQECPQTLLDLLTKVPPKQKTSIVRHHSKDEVSSLLKNIDHNIPNDGWVKVGMALQSWDNVEGLKLWEDWSKGGNTYRPDECSVRWKSFQSGHFITLGTLHFMSSKSSEIVVESEFQRLLNDTALCTLEQLEEVIMPALKSLALSDSKLEIASAKVKSAYKDLINVTMPINVIRSKLKGVIEKERMPDWCKNWVYVDNIAKYVNVISFLSLSRDGFNLLMGREVPLDAKGKPSATKYVADLGFVEVVSQMEYCPALGAGISTVNGVRILNCYNTKNVPVPAKRISDQGRSAIEMIEHHLEVLCGDQSNIFLQWLAFQVQHKGIKILWAPVIQSIEGLGKTFIGDLLGLLLGQNNVGKVSPSQVVSNFNGWASDVSVNVLEELRVQGHNKYDVVNSLKPLLTDEFIQINKKGVSPYKITNSTNYLCFTNYKNSLPLTKNDRRWWIIFSKIDNLELVGKGLDLSKNEYFDRLFDTLNYTSEILKWLLEIPISKKFKSLRQAPPTIHKDSMIASITARVEGLEELKDIIDEGGELYNTSVVQLTSLFCDFAIRYPHIELSKTVKADMLLELGFTRFPYSIKINSTNTKFWTNGLASVKDVRLALGCPTNQTTP